MTPLLEISDLARRFPGVVALKGVSMDVGAGEIHGLLGENGAGKSTLLKIISGAQTPSEGAIRFAGQPYAPAGPQDAQRLGIVTIHQEFNLIPTLSIAENIFIGRHPTTALGFVDWRRLRSDSRAALARIGLDADPDTLVSVLSVAEQQMVEIARALSMAARLIVMDEPTSALSEAETRRLLDLMRALRRDGVSVMFVTHRIEEAVAVCDRITVLRDGALAGRLERADISIPRIVSLMVGRRAQDLYVRPGRRATPGAVRLQVEGLSTDRPRRANGVSVRDVSFSVRAGEILGLAGLVGAGRTEIARAIFGADPRKTGTISIDGVVTDIRSPIDAIRAGVGLAPEDRKAQALFLMLAIRQNFSVAAGRRFKRLGAFVHEAREDEALARFKANLSIRMTGPGQIVRNLSGGNQQKIVLARWLALSPKVLIVDEPTRGVDVAAKADVHELLVDLARQGIAVVVISSESSEVLALADRIVTLRNGVVTGEVMAEEATEEGLMALMALDAAERAA